MFKRSCSFSSSSSAHSGAEKDQVKYKGVRLRKWGKWVSEIRLPNSRERIWLGSYDSAEKAARAFDAAQFCLRGPNAKFNFEDSPSTVDVVGGGGGRGMLTPAEIQDIASQHAKNFGGNDLDHRPQENNDEVMNGNNNSNNAEAEDHFFGSQTIGISSYSDGAIFGTENMDYWPTPYYDNILEQDPNDGVNVAATAAGTGSNNINPALPDYGSMFSTLDHLHEDMYMTPHLGNRFDDNVNGGQDEQTVDEHDYHQQSFLWNF